MSFDMTDASLLEDFITESSELIEQLDSDLVELEHQPESKPLLDGIFRALHTIKGSASFLNQPEITGFAHVSEGALNRLRKGEIRVDAEVMDALLSSVDVLRDMLDQIGGGGPVQEGPKNLIDALNVIIDRPSEGGEQSAGEQDQDPAGQPEPLASTPEADPNSQPAADGAGPTEIPLGLPPDKAVLVEFMAGDLQESAQQVDDLMDRMRDPAGMHQTADSLVELAEGMHATSDFFRFDALTRMIDLLAEVGHKMAHVPETLWDEIIVRVLAVRQLIFEFATGLERKAQISWPIETLADRLTGLLEGNQVPEKVRNQHGLSWQKVLELDEVRPMSAGAAQTETKADAKQETATQPDGKQPQADTPDNKPKADESTQRAGGGAAGSGTVRVQVDRIEALLNLVGQLVLAKNRVLAMSRELRNHSLPVETIESTTAVSGELDCLTSELQVAVMRTRMQPLSKLFDRYTRIIRDLARSTGKEINLDVVGKETEVDKNVTELLADPLVHILRNSADHGVELPDVREKAGKSRDGMIRLKAEHQGSHVRVEIQDDGKGLDRDVLGAKAIERGLITEDQLASLSDSEVFQFIFAAGFSTAVQVTDLSGRGVGMDVVRTNVSKLNGTVNVYSTKGQGTTIEVLIPLTVAIMPAMMVIIGRSRYAVPLASIVEIVRPEETSMHTVAGKPMMRLRDAVLPLVDMQGRLSETESDRKGRFAVVVGVGEQRIGLVVDGLVGQQEIVIKPLEDKATGEGPFSGATILDDGSVSLILDVIRLVRTTQGGDKAAA